MQCSRPISSQCWQVDASGTIPCRIVWDRIAHWEVWLIEGWFVYTAFAPLDQPTPISVKLLPVFSPPSWHPQSMVRPGHHNAAKLGVMLSQLAEMMRKDKFLLSSSLVSFPTFHFDDHDSSPCSTRWGEYVKQLTQGNLQTSATMTLWKMKQREKVVFLIFFCSFGARIRRNTGECIWYRRLPGGVVSGLFIVLGMCAILESNVRKTKRFIPSPGEVTSSKPCVPRHPENTVAHVTFFYAEMPGVQGVVRILYLWLPMLLLPDEFSHPLKGLGIMSMSYCIKLLNQVLHLHGPPGNFQTHGTCISCFRAKGRKGERCPRASIGNRPSCHLPWGPAASHWGGNQSWPASMQSYAISHKNNDLALLSCLHLLTMSLVSWMIIGSLANAQSWLKDRTISQRIETSLKSCESQQWKVAHWLMIFVDMVLANVVHHQVAHTIMPSVMRTTYQFEVF